jgi:hypothetical protein
MFHVEHGLSPVFRVSPVAKFNKPAQNTGWKQPGFPPVLRNSLSEPKELPPDANLCRSSACRRRLFQVLSGFHNLSEFSTAGFPARKALRPLT